MCLSSISGVWLLSKPSAPRSSEESHAVIPARRAQLSRLGVAAGVLFWLCQAAQSASVNDPFAQARLLSGTGNSLTVSDSNVGATRETNEPAHARRTAVRSIWFRWTAPANGAVTIDTIGSSFDTLLACYTGGVLSTLAPLAANDDINYSARNLQSRISFQAVAGTIYQIAVDGFNGASGAVKLNLSQQTSASPANDHFANARALSGASGLDTAQNVGATKQAGEPNHAGNAGGASIWYKWTAPTSGNATFSTAGSSYNTLLAIYTGSSLADLVQRAANNDISAGNTQSFVTYEVAIGITYYIAVDGFGGATGNGALQWSLGTIRPANDNFASAAPISGANGTAYGNSVQATKEVGEAQHAGNSGGASIWYRWVAPTSDSVVINTAGSSFDTLLGVYIGTTLGALNSVAQNDNDGGALQSRVAFAPVAGTTYHIAVDGANGQSGNVVLNWVQSTSRPPLDQFSSALAISGSTGQVTQTSINATKQAGEPNHAGSAGGASIWFKWTAAVTAPIFFETVGSSFNTLLAVYTGTAVNNLTPVASNDNISADYLQSRVRFNAVAGVQYSLAVDGVGGTGGSVRLKWFSGSTLPDLIIWGPSANPTVAELSFASTHCAVVEGYVTAGTHRLLRFSSESRNIGTADVSLGSPSGNPLFEYASCHGHYHLHGYMSYRLLNASGQTAATGFKTGFCLLDSIRWDSGASSTAKYHCGNQGIQKGWGDIYTASLDGQWVVITGLPNGLYYLEMTVNPDRVLPELDYSNNLTLIPVGIGAPPNDAFSAAQVLSADFTSVPSYNMSASAESGEPNHAGTAAKRSVWFKWKPASNSPATLDTVGSAFDTRLAVYTGAAVSSLTRVASNDDINGSANLQSRVSFNANSAITYFLAVDGYNGANGIIKLNRSSGSALNAAPIEVSQEESEASVELVPILEASRLSLGELKLTIQGEPNRSYLIEVSTDLLHWLPVTSTLADSMGKAFFINNSSTYAMPPPSLPIDLPFQQAAGHVHVTGHEVDHAHETGHEQPDEHRLVLFYRAALEKHKP